MRSDNSSPRPAVKLMLGNEIIARSAIGAGVRFASGYPGSPSSEILEYALKYVRDGVPKIEWSVNEMVAVQTAAAASFSGLRAIVAMKHNGMAVCLDFLESLAYTGVRGGLLLISCDDSEGTMSGTKGDARMFAKLAKVPCIEPCSHREIATAMEEGFRMSEELRSPIIIRSTTALSHSREPHLVEPLEVLASGHPEFNPSDRVLDFPPLVPSLRADLHRRLQQAAETFGSSRLNSVEGPPGADVAVVAVGTGALYAREAIRSLPNAAGKIVLVSLATVWPTPKRFLAETLKGARWILVVEESEPFIETALKEVVADFPLAERDATVLGRDSGDLPGPGSRDCGALDSGQVARALSPLIGEASDRAKLPVKDGDIEAQMRLQALTVSRPPALCAGCPHRASLLAVQTVVKFAGEGTFVVGDIGCYGLGAGPSGYNVINVLHNMGASIGVALGFASLRAIGFRQRVLALVGDSTFLHAGLPALAQAAATKAPLVVLILDNGVTAMTGLQSNPATDQAVRIEEICRGMGVEAVTLDPFDVKRCALVIAELLALEEPAVAILRAPCALLPRDTRTTPYQVNQETCVGSSCGCDRFCARVLGCPANLFDEAKDKAYIDVATCTGCGLCAQFCPVDAITRMPQ